MIDLIKRHNVENADVLYSASLCLSVVMRSSVGCQWVWQHHFEGQKLHMSRDAAANAGTMTNQLQTFWNFDSNCQLY
jgi:hypothetical protein